MGVWGCSPPPRKLPFRKAKRVVNCNSAGQLTGPRTIRELLFLKPCANDLTFGPTFHLTFAMRSLLMLAKCANEPNISPNI